MKKGPAASTVVVFLAIVLVAAVIVVAVGLGTDGATAITVGDRTMAAKSVNDELAEWADFPPAQARATAGAVNGAAGAAFTTQIVYEMLADEYLDRTGEQVTGADRAAARSSVARVKAFSERSAWFRDRYLQRAATFSALTRLVGEDDQGTAEVRVLRREARRVGVTVDPAYGRWAPVRALVTQYPTPFTPAQG